MFSPDQLAAIPLLLVGILGTLGCVAYAFYVVGFSHGVVHGMEQRREIEHG